MVQKDLAKWLKDPWRVVDAITILGPVVALLPHVSDMASRSLMFRILRVGRAVAFGTRASSARVRTRQGRNQLAGKAKPTVRVIRSEGDLHPVGVDSDSYIAWSQDPGQAWFHASSLSLDEFEKCARAAGVSDQELGQIRQEDASAKLRPGTGYATLVLQIPVVPTAVETDSPKGTHVHRDQFLAVITDRHVLTATTTSVDLQQSAGPHLRAVPAVSFPARVILAILSLACERNRLVAQVLETKAHHLDEQDTDRDFLPKSYGLRREITRAAFDMRHLRGVVQLLAAGEAKLGGNDLKDERYVRGLLSDTDALLESVDRTKEDLKALMDFHIDTKSFEVNKIVKLLTIVSLLGLIPSIAGGLLGMNVVGNPWSVTLGQVAFCVAMAMATALYVFSVKGWLR